MTAAHVLESDREKRDRISLSLRKAKDATIPDLKYWNNEACLYHQPGAPRVDCEYQMCGGPLFAHQRVAIAWAYIRKKGILGDAPGMGKTNSALGLLALLKQRGEIAGRMLIIVQTPSVLQWLAEARRWVPGINVDAVYSGLNKNERRKRYAKNWDAMIIGYHMLLQDHEILENFEIKNLVIDDVDPVINPETTTHHVITRFSENADRCLHMNATTVQTRPQNLHAALVPVGGLEVFGTLKQFESRYVRTETVRELTASGRTIIRQNDVGIRNGTELREKLAPMYLRRNYTELTDTRIPEMMPPTNVWLELHPEQRKRYTELQAGILTLKREEGTKISQVDALQRFLRGQQICAGLPALREPDAPQASVKLDWLMSRVTQQWQKQKVVVFIKNVPMVAAAQQRLQNLGVEYATIWGEESRAQMRQQEVARFTSDPKCRVMLGTSAMERSLNLQAANIFVFIDMHLNPARCAQLVGRVRRAGSRHEHVFVFNVFAADTQESCYLDVLRKRQAIADYAWEEQSELFEQLSPTELLNLIAP